MSKWTFPVLFSNYCLKEVRIWILICNIINILHGFDDDIPKYLHQGDRKALDCYVARCRRQWITFPVAEGHII